MNIDFPHLARVFDNPTVYVEDGFEKAVRVFKKRFNASNTIKTLKLRKKFVTTKKRREQKRRRTKWKF